MVRGDPLNYDKSVIKKILSKLTQKELFVLYHDYRQNNVKRLSVSANKDFIINKITEELDFIEVFNYSAFNKLVIDEINHLYKIFYQVFEKMNMEDFELICTDLNKMELFNKGKSKKEIIDGLLGEMDLDDLWKSKNLRDRFNPKYVTISDLDKINAAVKNLKDEFSTKEKIQSDMTYNKIGRIENNIEKIFYDQKRTNQEIFEFIEKGHRNYDVFYKNFFNVYKKTGGKITNDNIDQIMDLIKKDLNYDRKSYLLNGLEAMITHYFFNVVSEMDYKPDRDVFWNILNEEFKKVELLQNRAEIYVLRNNVTARLNMEKKDFDEMLLTEWAKGNVRLDMGAPIGRQNVEYLVTKEGTKYFYISFFR